jgi:hypothetical protein
LLVFMKLHIEFIRLNINRNFEKVREKKKKKKTLNFHHAIQFMFSFITQECIKTKYI